MQIVEQANKIYALKINPQEQQNECTTWVGEDYEPLQGSLMKYGIKTFRNHRHILNPRIIKRTQEVFVVISGSVKVTIYHETNRQFLGELTARAGEAIFVWDGFHEVAFTEQDTVAYEIKSGQFTTVQEDKEFF